MSQAQACSVVEAAPAGQVLIRKPVARSPLSVLFPFSEIGSFQGRMRAHVPPNGYFWVARYSNIDTVAQGFVFGFIRITFSVQGRCVSEGEPPRTSVDVSLNMRGWRREPSHSHIVERAQDPIWNATTAYLSRCCVPLFLPSMYTNLLETQLLSP